MATELNNYAYWGLVGKSVSQVGSSISSGYATAGKNSVLAGGYAASAEMLDIEAEQELINADAKSNARMEQFNQNEAANVAVLSAMGKTAENTTISDANAEAANKDVAAIQREGRYGNISARSGASAARSAAKQADIARKSAGKQALWGGASAIGGGVMSAGMMGAGAPKADWQKGSQVTGTQFRSTQAVR